MSKGCLCARGRASRSDRLLGIAISAIDRPGAERWIEARCGYPNNAEKMTILADRVDNVESRSQGRPGCGDAGTCTFRVSKAWVRRLYSLSVIARNASWTLTDKSTECKSKRWCVQVKKQSSMVYGRQEKSRDSTKQPGSRLKRAFRKGNLLNLLTGYGTLLYRSANQQVVVGLARSARTGHLIRLASATRRPAGRAAAAEGSSTISFLFNGKQAVYVVPDTTSRDDQPSDQR